MIVFLYVKILKTAPSSLSDSAIGTLEDKKELYYSQLPIVEEIFG